MKIRNKIILPMFVLFGSGGFLGCGNGGQKYIVTAKENDKVMFKGIDTPNTKHIMHFEYRYDPEFSRRYYNAIRVGDTLDIYGVMNQTVVRNTFWDVDGTRSQSIRFINNRDAIDVIKSREHIIKNCKIIHAH